MDHTIADVRVLVAACGHEPGGWAGDVLSGVPSAPGLVVRLLVVLDAPRPPCTSLTPWARRRHAAARATWRRLEEDRARPIEDELRAALGSRLEVVRIPAREADPGRTVAEHATAWGAGLVVVAQDTPSWLHRWLFGEIHERVVRRSPCAVVVVPAHAGTRPAPRRAPFVALNALGVEGRR